MHAAGAAIERSRCSVLVLWVTLRPCCACAVAVLWQLDRLMDLLWLEKKDKLGSLPGDVVPVEIAADAFKVGRTAAAAWRAWHGSKCKCGGWGRGGGGGIAGRPSTSTHGPYGSTGPSNRVLNRKASWLLVPREAERGAAGFVGAIQRPWPASPMPTAWAWAWRPQLAPSLKAGGCCVRGLCGNARVPT